METVAYFREAAREFHAGFLSAVRDLTEGQLHFRPLGKGNSIAFLLWHCVRTEDILVHLFLQKRKPLWNVEGWDRKLGMDPKAQGTGMTAEESASLAIGDPREFLRYAEKVFLAAEGFLDGLPEDALDEIREYPVIGKRSVRQVIGSLVLQHGAGHSREIAYVKGLQGMRGSPV